MPNRVELKKRIAEIEASANDPEKAHSLEDELLWDFVKHVAIGRQRYITQCAQVLYSLKEKNYERWTA